MTPKELEQLEQLLEKFVGDDELIEASAWPLRPAMAKAVLQDAVTRVKCAKHHCGRKQPC